MEGETSVKIEPEEDLGYNLQQKEKFEFKFEIDLPIKSEGYFKREMNCYQQTECSPRPITFPPIKEELTPEVNPPIKSEEGFKEELKYYQQPECWHGPTKFLPIKEEQFMLSLEKSSRLALWTLAPSAVVYSCLFCLNPSLLLRCCRLVVRYQNVSSKVVEGFLAERQMSRAYMWDMVHILLEGNIFDVRHNGYIFNNVPDKPFADLAKVVRINNAFTLQNHLAFRPVVYSALTQEQAGGLDKDEVIDILEEYFGQMSFLLNLSKED